MKFIIFALAMFFSNSAEAAAWLKKAGDKQLIHQLSYYSTDEAYDNNGNSFGVEDFPKTEYQIYYEQGWGPDITVGGSLRLQSLSQDLAGGGEDTNLGIPDLEFFARLPIYRDDAQVLSVQPLVRIANPDADNESPRLGSDESDLEARLLYGRNFDNKGKFFGNFELAYRYRTGNSSDEIRIDPTLGYNYSDKLLLLGQIFSTWSVENGNSNLLSLSGSEDYDLVKLQASGVYKIDDGLSMQLGGFSHVDGENTGGGGGVLFGIWQEF